MQWKFNVKSRLFSHSLFTDEWVVCERHAMCVRCRLQVVGIVALVACAVLVCHALLCVLFALLARRATHKRIFRGERCIMGGAASAFFVLFPHHAPLWPPSYHLFWLLSPTSFPSPPWPFLTLSPSSLPLDSLFHPFHDICISIRLAFHSTWLNGPCWHLPWRLLFFH